MVSRLRRRSEWLSITKRETGNHRGHVAKFDLDWKERFGKHTWRLHPAFRLGAFVSAGPPQNGGDKVLRSYERLNAVIDAVQLATLFNGAALVASGIALRRGWRWGYPLAVVCGIVLVVAGFIFLAGFHHLQRDRTWSMASHG